MILAHALPLHNADINYRIHVDTQLHVLQKYKLKHIYKTINTT